MPETRKPQWVRCGECGHEWIGLYMPIEVWKKSTTESFWANWGRMEKERRSEDEGFRVDPSGWTTSGGVERSQEGEQETEGEAKRSRDSKEGAVHSEAPARE